MVMRYTFGDNKLTNSERLTLMKDLQQRSVPFRLRFSYDSKPNDRLWNFVLAKVKNLVGLTILHNR